jgi:hypothetical protein
VDEGCNKVMEDDVTRQERYGIVGMVVSWKVVSSKWSGVEEV